MKQIKYTPDAAEKLRFLNKTIALQYGRDTAKEIRIINIYNEKEDFMWQLFGIDTTPQETIDYWNE